MILRPRTILPFRTRVILSVSFSFLDAVEESLLIEVEGLALAIGNDTGVGDQDTVDDSTISGVNDEKWRRLFHKLNQLKVI